MRRGLFDHFCCLAIAAVHVLLPLAGCLRECRAEPLDAVVQVRCAIPDQAGGYYSGSGTVIDAEGHVLTCHHVLEYALDRGSRDAIVTWRSGFSTPMRVVNSDPRWDVCLLAPAQPLRCHDFYPLASDEELPKQGDEVELVGYGGGQFRHWSGPLQGYAQHNTEYYDQVSVATQSISGDSGGAITFNGKLIGVLWGGPTHGHGGPMKATQGTCSQTLGLWLEKCCRFTQRRGCSPCEGGMCPLPPIFYQRPRPQPQQRPPAQPQQPAPRVQTIVGPPGPPGKDGRDGQDGASCDTQAVTQAVIAALEPKLPTAEQIADQMFAKYGDELRGPAGKNGTNGRDGASGQSATLPNLDAAIAAKIREKLRIEVQHE